MRTLPEVNKDFSEVCARYGFATFELELKKKEVEDLLEKLKVLNFEAAEVRQAIAKP